MLRMPPRESCFAALDRRRRACGQNGGSHRRACAQPEPAAVRRAGRGGAVDMFGAAAHEDVMTSASANPAAHAGEDKLTGARNENSVLFSLSALTGGDSKGGSSSSADQGRANLGQRRSACLDGIERHSGSPASGLGSKLDDIMNLGGGGVYSPALMAPALSPPSVDFSSVAADNAGGESKSKSKTLILGLVGGVALVAVAAVAFSLGSKSEVGDKSRAAPPRRPRAAKGRHAQLAAENPAPAPEPTTAAGRCSPGADTRGGSHGAGPRSGDPQTERARQEGGRPQSGKSCTGCRGGAQPAPPPEPKPAPAAAPAAGGSGDFDRASALTALSAAASAAQSCKKADGPTGSGRIAVTFANNGAATTATVEGPPSPAPRSGDAWPLGFEGRTCHRSAAHPLRSTKRSTSTKPSPFNSKRSPRREAQRG